MSPGGIPRDLLPRHHGCRGSPRPTGSQRGGETEVDRFVTWESSGIVGKLGKFEYIINILCIYIIYISFIYNLYIFYIYIMYSP